MQLYNFRNSGTGSRILLLGFYPRYNLKSRSPYCVERTSPGASLRVEASERKIDLRLFAMMYYTKSYANDSNPARQSTENASLWATIEGVEMARLAVIAFKQGSDIVADSIISDGESEIGRHCDIVM